MQPALIDLAKIKAQANTCRTRRHFHNLLRQFRSYVPYECLVYGWGYHPDFVLAFLGDDHYPPEYLAYYVQDSVLQKDPIFAEWLRTGRSQIWKEVLQRIGPSNIDPTYLRMTREYGLSHTLAGGSIDDSIACFFALGMKTDDACYEYFECFNECVAALCQAVRHAFPRPTLTYLQVEILTLLRHGYSHQEVADQLNKSVRTIRSHVEKTRNKLHAQTTAQAIAIAQATGILTSQPSLPVLFPNRELVH